MSDPTPLDHALEIEPTSPQGYLLKGQLWAQCDTRALLQEIRDGMERQNALLERLIDQIEEIVVKRILKT